MNYLELTPILEKPRIYWDMIEFHLRMNGEFLKWHAEYEKSRKLKLGIVGHGFVGKATDWGFNKNIEKFIVDRIYKTTIKDLSDFNPEIIFICVPTPMEDDGAQNSEIITSVIKDLLKYCPKATKVVKALFCHQY